MCIVMRSKWFGRAGRRLGVQCISVNRATPHFPFTLTVKSHCFVCYGERRKRAVVNGAHGFDGWPNSMKWLREPYSASAWKTNKMSCRLLIVVVVVVVGGGK
jgi:hypothetical protein